jgi:hypothetical protein
LSSNDISEQERGLDLACGGVRRPGSIRRSGEGLGERWRRKRWWQGERKREAWKRERNSSRLMYKITGSNFVKHLTVLVYALGTQDNSYHFYII